MSNMHGSVGDTTSAMLKLVLRITNSADEGLNIKLFCARVDPHVVLGEQSPLHGLCMGSPRDTSRFTPFAVF